MGNAVRFEVAHTALLAMDCQSGIVSIYAKPPEEFVERASSVLRANAKSGYAGGPRAGRFPTRFTGSQQSEQALRGDQVVASAPRVLRGRIHPALGPILHTLRQLHFGHPANIEWGVQTVDPVKGVAEALKYVKQALTA